MVTIFHILLEIINDRRKYYNNGRNYGLDVMIISSLVVKNVFQKNGVLVCIFDD